MKGNQSERIYKATRRESKMNLVTFKVTAWVEDEVLQTDGLGQDELERVLTEMEEVLDGQGWILFDSELVIEREFDSELVIEREGG